MPKILYINCACTGSTGKIIADTADYAVLKGYACVLCAPCDPGDNENIRYIKTSIKGEQGFYRRLNRFYGYQYGFAPLSTARIKRMIKKEKPDIVHLHCINGYMVNIYSLFRFIKKHSIPTVVTNHAEFFYTGNCPLAYECDRWKIGCGQCTRIHEATGGYHRDTTSKAWNMMKKAFSDMKSVVMTSVSPWVEGRAKQSPIVSGIPQEVVKNGVNTSIFTYQDPLAIRKKYGYSESTKIIFHPTANFSASESDRKNGRYLIALAESMREDNVMFVVAGRHSPGLQVPPNVVLLGLVSDQNVLAEYYAMADVTVVTGRQETFNMPVAESMCCGTPVVGFYAGGPESIAISKYSKFCEQGDMRELEVAVRQMIAENYDKQMISECAKQEYAAEVMASKYMSIYDRLINNEG